jgi:hypothetical protein
MRPFAHCSLVGRPHVPCYGCGRLWLEGDDCGIVRDRFFTNRCANTNLTCSEISSVVPAESTHFPRKSSPKKGFRGFFSFPNFSLRLAYCCLNVLRNHFSTNSALFSGSFSAAGATKIEGCSAQYEENSTSDVDERINGGAVKDERSPEKDAMDFKKALHDPRFCADTPAPSVSLEAICRVVEIAGMPRGMIDGFLQELCTDRLFLRILC